MGLETTYFERNPTHKLWCNMDETQVELDTKETTTITTIGSKSV